jgi:hypothetical protein
MTTQLNTSAKRQSATTGRGLASRAWHPISATTHEMNYATSRLAELNVHVPARPGA